MKDSNSPSQVFRVDGKGVFLEVMLNGLPYDKVLLNLVAYDGQKAVGGRKTGEIPIFLDVFTAIRLAGDILSGRISKLGERARKKAEKEEAKYPEHVFEVLGGTSSRRSSTGKPVARQMTLSPGSTQPWVITAKMGLGKEVGPGLIALDGPPQVTVRVPVSSEKLKELAYALEMVVRMWERLRFEEEALPLMKVARDRRKEAVERAIKEKED